MFSSSAIRLCCWSAANSGRGVDRSPPAMPASVRRARDGSQPNSTRNVRSNTTVNPRVTPTASKPNAADIHASASDRLSASACAEPDSWEVVSMCLSNSWRKARHAGVSSALSTATTFGSLAFASPCTLSCNKAWVCRNGARVDSMEASGVPWAAVNASVWASSYALRAESRFLYAVALPGSKSMLRNACPICRPLAYMLCKFSRTRCSVWMYALNCCLVCTKPHMLTDRATMNSNMGAPTHSSNFCLKFIKPPQRLGAHTCVPPGVR